MSDLPKPPPGISLMSTEEYLTRRAPKNLEDRVVEFLKCLDFEEAKVAEEWVRSFGTITLAFAEFTGGHITAEELHRLMAEECFK